MSTDDPTGFDVLALDPNYDGSCPCADVVIGGVRLLIHCWRTCSDCTYAGVHFTGPDGREVAERVVPLLKASWGSEWQTFEMAS